MRNIIMPKSRIAMLKLEIINALNKYSDVYKNSSMPEHHIRETTKISNMAEKATNPVLLRQSLEEKVDELKKTIPWYAMSALYKEKKLYKFLLEVLNNPKFSIKFLLYDWANQSSNNQPEPSSAATSNTEPKNEELQKEIKRLNTSLEGYKQRNAQLETENEQLKNEVKKLKAEIERLESLYKNAAQKNEKEVPLRDMATQDDELQKLKDENSYLKKVNSDRGNKINQYAKDILEFERKIEELKGKLAQYQHQSNSNKPGI